MKNHKYEKAVASNAVTDDLLIRLGMLEDPNEPPKAVVKKVNKSGF